MGEMRDNNAEASNLEKSVADVSPAYEAYKTLEHWQPIRTIKAPEQFLDLSHYAYNLFTFLYEKTKALYRQVPSRYNGEGAFIHPINVAWAVKRAGVQDGLTYCVALIHDVVEETVDMYKREKDISDDASGMALLDEYEQTVFSDLEKDLREHCQQNGIKQSSQEPIVGTVRLLTRHKRHFYYQSISQIFNCPDEGIRERAIEVKLADCFHNGLSIEKFSEEIRIYQCFKNLFILNNAKEYLLREGISQSAPMHKLFTKCAEATYDGFLNTGYLALAKGITRIASTLQLVEKDYEKNRAGFVKVTQMEEDENHPIRLFQGIIRKYDARLHHEYDLFKEKTEKERDYCRDFFREFNFTPEQLQAVIDYKDAYALKEVVAWLLLEPTYVLQRFLCSGLTSDGRIGQPGKSSIFRGYEPASGHL